MSDEDDILPAGWIEAPISDLAVERVEQSGPTEASVFTYIDIGSVDNAAKAIVSPKVMECRSAPSRARQSVKTGDVLVSMTRPNLNAVACVPPELDGAIASTGFDVLRSSEIHPDWIFAHVRSQPFVEKMTSLVRGALYPAVNSREVRSYVISVPPVAEQKRIISKISSLENRSRKVREALEAVGPLLNHFRQSVLAAAFRGDLTADWRAAHPDTEPASALLARIRQERRHKWEKAELPKMKAKGKKPTDDKWKERYEEPEPVVDADLPDLPEGWCWCPLHEVGYLNRGKSRHRPRNAEHLYGGAYPFVQTGDIANSGGKILRHSQTYSEAGLEQSRLWPTGTVCITIAANIASSAVLTYPACFPDSVVGVIPDSQLCSPEFLEFFLRTAKENLERFAPATAQKNINVGILNDVAVPLPPSGELRELVSRVTHAFRAISCVEIQVSDALRDLSIQDQSILAKAFRGELVPQDRNDEPASLLLERIRAAREPGESNDNGNGTRRKGRLNHQPDVAATDDGPRPALEGKPAAKDKPDATAKQLELFQKSDGRTTHGNVAVASTALPIDVTDRDEVMAAVREVFTDGVTRDRETALRELSNALGYGRLGARIRDALDGDLRTAVRRGILENTPAGLRILCRNISDYDRDFLIEQLLAGIGTNWWDREVLIEGTARWLGYRRTGPVIAETLASAITLAIRREILSADGSRVRRLK